MPSHRASTGCSAYGEGDAPDAGALSRQGQGTLEYALVVAAFLAMLVGAAALWKMLDAGLPVQHALQSASHHISSAAPGAFSDVFMY
ncbi:MAG: hypothetical protein Q3963_00170 [Coriobacteriaceae bacterium]|nr:hypothetical protein [Coriobacteriaceae bacterium]